MDPNQWAWVVGEDPHGAMLGARPTAARTNGWSSSTILLRVPLTDGNGLAYMAAADKSEELDAPTGLNIEKKPTLNREDEDVRRGQLNLEPCIICPQLPLRTSGKWEETLNLPSSPLGQDATGVPASASLRSLLQGPEELPTFLAPYSKQSCNAVLCYTSK